jgi:hypothetical protein
VRVFCKPDHAANLGGALVGRQAGHHDSVRRRRWVLLVALGVPCAWLVSAAISLPFIRSPAIHDAIIYVGIALVALCGLVAYAAMVAYVRRRARGGQAGSARERRPPS